jgi:transposase
MAAQPGLFDVDARLRELSAKGDDLERVNALVDFETFRPELEQAVPRADRAKGGRPPYDHVLMFRILILQASHSLSGERTEYLVKDRLSFMRFLGLSLADRVPDANSIWNFREALTRAQIGGVPAIEALFRRFEAQLSAAGYIAMGGQIVDATVVAAPKQRNTGDEKRALKEGRIPEAWGDCREFRVRAGIMGRKEIPHGPTQDPENPGRAARPASGRCRPEDRIRRQRPAR